MRTRLVLVVAARGIVVGLPACRLLGGGAASAPPGEAGARSLLEQFLKPGADHKALTAPLKPSKADVAAVYQRDLEPIYNQVIDSVRRRRRILALVQDALSQLRLDIKYLMFDLEVTRRERDALRDHHADD